VAICYEDQCIHPESRIFDLASDAKQNKYQYYSYDYYNYVFSNNNYRKAHGFRYNQKDQSTTHISMRNTIRTPFA
jgi:hypothetical protein